MRTARHSLAIPPAVGAVPAVADGFESVIWNCSGTSYVLSVAIATVMLPLELPLRIVSVPDVGV